MKYHIGEQIQRKVLLTQQPVGKVAEEIGVERQSLYSIFKAPSINTERLMKICEVLNYDFFADLSAVFNHKENDVVDNSADFGLSLIHSDELPVLSDMYMTGTLLRNYMNSESEQPLVIFYAADGDIAPDIILKQLDALDLEKSEDVSRQIPRQIHRELMLQPWDDGEGWGKNLVIEENESYCALIYTGGRYAAAVKNCIELMKPGRKIILLMPVESRLYAGAQGGLMYDDVADEMFRRYHATTNMVVVQGEGSRYLRCREYFKAYCGDGLFDRLSRQFFINEEIEREIFDLAMRQRVISVREVVPQNETGYCRLSLSYPQPDEKERELLFHNGVNDTPMLTMWIDIRNGVIIDYQQVK